MTDRLFAPCCYGTPLQHGEWQECPAPTQPTLSELGNSLERRMAHTPGPWFMVRHAGDGGEIWSQDPDGDALVAHVCDRDDELANTCLIAAAPELLTALREAIELLDDCEIAHPLRWESAVRKAEGLS